MSDITERNEKMIELLRSGRTPSDIASEFGLSQQMVSALRIKECARLLRLGKSPDQICSEMHVKPKTVQNLIDRIEWWGNYRP